MAADPSDRFGTEGLTFDDVLLVPAASDVLPNQVSTASRVVPGIALELPILSAAMDTVTESALAIAMARSGGLGIVHRNLSVADQASEVDKVKRSESGMIVDPVTLGPDALVADALELIWPSTRSPGCRSPTATSAWWASSPTVTCASTTTSASASPR